MEKNSVIYQVLIDRFNNKSENLFSKINSPDYNEKFQKYLGGKFKGITNKAEYIKSLGITHLMINPVQECKYYHGYLPENNFKINKNFGNEQDLKEMINKFHDLGIKVILDVVLTHISSTNPVFLEKSKSPREEDKDWFLWIDRMKKHPKYKYYFAEMVYKLTDGEPERLSHINSAPYLGYFGLEDHPLLNLENPKVKQWNKKHLEFWLDKFKFDAIRLDSGYIQPKKYINEIHNFLKQKGLELIVEYWAPEHTVGNCVEICDAEFDIPETLLLNSLNKNLEGFKHISHYYYFFQRNLIGAKPILAINNHDLPRFDGGPELQKIATTLQFTLPSIPLVYYGDEICMGTYNNRRDRIAQSRDPMGFTLRNDNMTKFYRNLIKFRTQEYKGDIEIGEMQVNDNNSLLTYSLKIKEKEYHILLNREYREKPVNLSHLFAGKIKNFDILSNKIISLENNEYLKMKPFSAYILSEK